MSGDAFMRWRDGQRAKRVVSSASSVSDRRRNYLPFVFRLDDGVMLFYAELGRRVLGLVEDRSQALWLRLPLGGGSDEPSLAELLMACPEDGHWLMVSDRPACATWRVCFELPVGSVQARLQVLRVPVYFD